MRTHCAQELKRMRRSCAHIAHKTENDFSFVRQPDIFLFCIVGIHKNKGPSVNRIIFCIVKYIKQKSVRQPDIFLYCISKYRKIKSVRQPEFFVRQHFSTFLNQLNIFPSHRERILSALPLHQLNKNKNIKTKT